MAATSAAAALAAFDDTALPSELASQEQANREPRYLFFAGDEPGLSEPGGMQIASPVVRNRVLWRCCVMPAVNALQRARVQEIPEGRLLDGTVDGRGIGAMLLPVGPEVDELLSQYGHADAAQWQRRWGLVELSALRGMQSQEVAALNLTQFFFPDWPDSLPTTNEEVITQLTGVLADLEAMSDDGKKRLFLSVGNDMLAAAKMAQIYQSRVIQDGNIRITFPDSNDRHKPAFDSKDELFALRSRTPLAVNALRGNQSDATAAGIENVLDKVLTRLIPAQQAAAPSLNPTDIAAIVAATVQALKETGPKVADEQAMLPKAVKK